jgi:hypothetical protein
MTSGEVRAQQVPAGCQEIGGGGQVLDGRVAAVSLSSGGMRGAAGAVRGVAQRLPGRQTGDRCCRRVSGIEFTGDGDVGGVPGQSCEEAIELPDGGEPASLASSGRSPRKETAASACWLAEARNSPKVGVMVAAGHQLADFHGAAGGVLARGTVHLVGCGRRCPCQDVVQRRGEGGYGIGDLIDVRVWDGHASRGLSCRPGGGNDGAAAMASQPSAAAAAVVMNAANSSGARSSHWRACHRMVSNASKPAARASGSVAQLRMRACITSICCTPFTCLPRLVAGPGRASPGAPTGSPR